MKRKDKMTTNGWQKRYTEKYTNPTKPELNSSVPNGYAVPDPLVAHTVLLLSDTNITLYREKQNIPHYWNCDKDVWPDVSMDCDND